MEISDGLKLEMREEAVSGLVGSAFLLKHEVTMDVGRSGVMALKLDTAAKVDEPMLFVIDERGRLRTTNPLADQDDSEWLSRPVVLGDDVFFATHNTLACYSIACELKDSLAGGDESIVGLVNDQGWLRVALYSIEEGVTGLYPVIYSDHGRLKIGRRLVNLSAPLLGELVSSRAGLVEFYWSDRELLFQIYSSEGRAKFGGHQQDVGDKILDIQVSEAGRICCVTPSRLWIFNAERSVKLGGGSAVLSAEAISQHLKARVRFIRAVSLSTRKAGFSTSFVAEVGRPDSDRSLIWGLCHFRNQQPVRLELAEPQAYFHIQSAARFNNALVVYGLRQSAPDKYEPTVQSGRM